MFFLEWPQQAMYHTCTSGGGSTSWEMWEIEIGALLVLKYNKYSNIILLLLYDMKVFTWQREKIVTVYMEETNAVRQYAMVRRSS